MKRKGIPIVLALSVLAGTAFYLFTKKDKNKEAQKLKDKAKEYFQNGNYEKALKLYLKALSLIINSETLKKSILNNISLCYFLLKDYTKSINYSNKLLEIEPGNFKVLKRRYESHKALDLVKDALYDLSLLMKHDKQYENIFNELLEKVVKKEACEFVKRSIPHKIYIDEFLKPFLTLFKNNNYDILFDKLQVTNDKINFNQFKNEKNSNKNDNEKNISNDKFNNIDENVKFINIDDNEKLLFLSSLEIIKGDYDRALSIIKNQRNLFFKIFRSYINSINEIHSYEVEVEEIIMKLLDFNTNENSIANHKTNGFDDINENNFVPLLYCASFIRYNNDLFEKILEKGIQSRKPELFYSIKYAEMINYRRFNEALEIEKYLDQSVQSFILRIESFLIMKDYERLNVALNEMKEMYPNDPRTFIYFAMKFQSLKEDSLQVDSINDSTDKLDKSKDYDEKILNFIEKSIKCDENFFNSRLYKANFLMSIGKVELSLFKDALKCASRIDEFLTILKLIYLLEMKDKN
ncbi:Mitochondrial import receptor subunit TOM70 [Dictyocoela muelleri]|nr:Mitochondrial import receptor subunit TOM70 [Dictyocoela muelleri]